MQQTAVDGCTRADGSLELGGISFLQFIVGMRPDTTSKIKARREIVTPME